MNWRIAAAMLPLIVFATSCRREDRPIEQPPSPRAAETIPLTKQQPAGALPIPHFENPSEENAFAVSEGKRLFAWFNCVGCHASGGGGSGPALMDDKWIYGSEPAQIFSTIMEGRPNGMPAFRGKIVETQVWQIVAYIRSLSGLLPKDVASGRNDEMRAKPDEQSTEKQSPKSGHYSPAGDMP